MALTGSGILIGTATEFGVGVRFPRGLASDGTVLLLFDANTGYNLDSNTGIATVIGSLSGFGVSEFALRGATYHNNQFVFYGNNRRRFFVYDPADGGAEQLTEQLTIQGSSVNPDVWGTASIDGTLWALERGTDKLYTVDIGNDMLIPVGTATDFGLPGSPNLQSFANYDGELLSISNGLQRLVQFNRTTGVATVVNDVAVPDAASEALSEHAGQLFLLGSSADALFRMYDVQWDTTIADLEVDEGANTSLDLSTVSDDAATFEFAPTHTARSWLTIVGTTLTVINAPTVAVDTDFSAVVHGVRDGVNAEKTLTVKVANTSSSVLSFGGGTIASQSWSVGTGVNLTLPGATGGTGAITYSLSPTLPGGVTFNTGTRVLSGTPTGRFTSGTFTYTATDGDGTAVELTFTIVVTATAISFASNIANQSWGVGTAVSLILPTASGGVGSFTYSLTPALPSGVTFTAATRALSGTPTATATVATYTYTATDSEGVTHTQTFTVVVAASVIAFASMITAQSWVVGTAVSLTLPTASGGVGAFTYSLSPTTPSGITFTPGTRILAGTPTGRFTSATFTYTAEDSDGVTQTQTFTIVVTAPAITFNTSIANQMWQVGTAVNVTMPTVSGGVGAFVYSLTPTLPAGITFIAGTRIISGTPTTAVASATFTYTATDAEGVTSSRTFTIVVAAADAIIFSGSIANQAWQVGTAVSLTLPTASGGVGLITFSLSPTLPTSVTFTPSTRLLTGNPTGRFSSTTFTYTAEDADGTTVSLTFTIIVTAVAITFSPTSFANQTWTTGTAVNQTLPAGAGGVGDLAPTLNPSLPSGIGFTASTRALAGNPTATFASATFTYTITDDEGESESITFTIIVNAEALSFNSETIANQSWRVDTAIPNLLLPGASGGDGAKTYSLSPTLPSGITFTGATRVLAGNPTAVFTSATFTYRVTDSAGSTLDLTFTIFVAAALIALGFGTLVIADQAWVVGTAVNLTLPVAVGDNPTKTYSLTPGTPAGIDFTASTRILSGTPTGRFSSDVFTYTVTDGDGDSVELTFTVIVVAVTLEFDSEIGNQTWKADVAVNLTLPSASGGVGAKTYALTGTFPTGVSRSAFAVTGTPTAAVAVMSFTWEVTDGENIAIQQTFTIVVNVSTLIADRIEAQRQTRLRSILPISASRLEVDLLDAFQEVLNEYVLMTFGSEETLDIPIRHLWDAETCPPAFLPFLALAMSVDTDISVFSIDQQRALIRDSFEVHRRKGTIGSIKRLIDSLGWTLTSDGIVEGYRDPTDITQIIRANGGWAQFSIHISNTIPTAQARAAAQFIQQLSPVSRRLYSFDFSGVPKYYDGGVNTEGDYTFLSDGAFTHGAVLTDESLVE